MKHLFTFITIALSIVVLNSCNKTQDNLSTNINDESLIISELKSFNDSLLINLSPTKGFNKETLIIVMADLDGAYKGAKTGIRIGSKLGGLAGNPALGAAIGGFIGGIGFGAFQSWLASPSSELSNDTPENLTNLDYNIITNAYSRYCMGDNDAIDLIYLESEKVKSQVLLDSTLINMVGLDENSMKVGQYHNVMLSALEGNLADTEKISTKADLGNQEFPKFETVLEAEILYSGEMCSAFNELYQTTEIVEENLELPDVIMQMYSELMNQYVSGTEDIIYIINKYTECIDNSSELTADEKNSLKMGLATSLYSYNYWANSGLII